MIPTFQRIVPDIKILQKFCHHTQWELEFKRQEPPAAADCD